MTKALAPGQIILLFALLSCGLAPSLHGQTPLTLQAAIAEGQQNGHLAKEAAATRDAAVYRHKVYKATLMPRIGLEATIPSYNHSISPVTQPDGTVRYLSQNQTNAQLSATLEQALPFSGGSMYVTSALGRFSLSGSQSRDTWNSTPFSVGVVQPLFQQNRAAWDRKAQELNIDLAEREYLETKETIAVQITGLYFDAYISSLTHQNAIATAAFNDTLLQITEQRYANGRIGESDKFNSQYRQLSSAARVTQTKNTSDRAAAALRLALGMPANAPLNFNVPVDVPSFVVDTARAAAEAIRNGVTPLTIERNRLQADRQVDLARKSNGLTANLNASLGFNGSADEFSGAYQKPSRAERATFLVSMPLLQYGARSNDIRAAESERNRTELASSYTLAQVAQDAHFTALDLNTAREQVLLAAKADTSAGKLYEMQFGLYTAGKVTIDQLFSAQESKNSAFSGYLGALRNYWQTYYRLREVTMFDFQSGQPIR